MSSSTDRGSRERSPGDRRVFPEPYIMAAAEQAVTPAAADSAHRDAAGSTRGKDQDASLGAALKSLMRDKSTRSTGPEKDVPSISYWELFEGATKAEIGMMALGTVGAAVGGSGLPVFTIVFAEVLDSLGEEDADFSSHVELMCIYFAALAGIVLVACFCEVGMWAIPSARIADRWRMRVLSATLSQDISWFDGDGDTGGIINSLSEDTSAVQRGTGEKVGNFVHHITACLVGLGIAFWKSWDLALVLVGTLPIMAGVAGGLGKITQWLNTRSSQAYGEAGGRAQEAFGNIRTVQAFGAEDAIADEYQKHLELPLRMGRVEGIVKGITLGALQFCFMGSFAIALFYGSFRVADGKISSGEVITVIFAGIIAGFSLGQAGPNVAYFQQAKMAGARMKARADRVPAIDERSPEGETPDSVQGNVELKDVVFRYPARPAVTVLKGISVSVPAGKTVALVGESGSGKSTIIALAERFYDPESGSVTLDGRDLRTLRVSWLRQQMGLVSQEPALFATTIAENIRYGKPGATDEEVMEAAKAANAHKYISSLPNGYATWVGERGVQLSGGQKQRVAIARAVLRNPRILLLDEATSALDSESEKIVQAALDSLAVGRTTIVIAHRLSTVRDADKIVVMKSGEVVEEGSHDELSRAGGAYTNLLVAQGGKADQTGDKARRMEVAKSILDRKDDHRHSLEDPKAKAADAADPDEPAGKMKGAFTRVMKLNAPEWKYISVGLIASLIAGPIQPLFAFVMSEIIDVFYRPDPDEVRRGGRQWALYMALLGVAALVSYTAQNAALYISGQKLAFRVRNMLFRRLLMQETAYFDHPKHSAGALCARLQQDAFDIRGAASDQMAVLLGSVAMLATAYIIGFIHSWEMTLLITGLLPLLVLGGLIESKFYMGFGDALDSTYAGAATVVSDAIGSVRAVQAYGLTPKIMDLYRGMLVEPGKLVQKHGYIKGIGFGYSQAIMYAMYAIAFYFAVYLIEEGRVDLEDILKALFAVIFAAIGLGQAQMAFPDLGKAMGAVKHVFTALDRKSLVDPSSPDGDCPDSVVGEMEIKNVVFRYPARPTITVLKGISVSVPAGKTVALVGESGSGKSTIIALAERFYDPESGSVTLDGRDLRTLRVSWLRQQMGLVSQEPALFATTIAENIRYGKPGATDEEVMEAAKAANAHKYISSLPNGYATWVGERGVQLSGGQKQRVAIARAVLRNPRILLLDEATSALDSESEKIVQDALDKLMVGRTTIAIAHRLSTVRDADKIVVMKTGKVVEEGSHQELMGSGGTYANLVYLQGGH
ncbi:unnamed protein product [Pedinophyceae sp. YPF-701]|nr:unnamed protein product [Pedinophyceae sp. YPF-701]